MQQRLIRLNTILTSLCQLLALFVIAIGVTKAYLGVADLSYDFLVR